LTNGKRAPGVTEILRWTAEHFAADKNNPIAMLRAQDLWKTYNKTDVVRGVSCHVDPGEILGFLGPNGAGKTTTVGMLYGGVLPTRGTIKYLDFAIPRQGRQARGSIGIVTQDDNLDPDFNVVDNLVTFARYHGFSRQQAHRRADELIEQVSLADHRNHKPDELSGGLKRRLVLARALINRPRLVFLDEPTTGLDPESRQGFWKLVTQLKSSGCGVVLTTHYMDEAQRLSDRLLLMQNGIIVDEGTPAELIERTVGSEILEVAGVEESLLNELAERTGAWIRPFGDGWLMSLSPDHRAHTVERLEAANPTLLAIRATNLEDVFLRLTGDELE
jgi:lipooligosaccharide transport system ATP-binding protein